MKLPCVIVRSSNTMFPWRCDVCDSLYTEPLGFHGRCPRARVLQTACHDMDAREELNPQPIDETRTAALSRLHRGDERPTPPISEAVDELDFVLDAHAVKSSGGIGSLTHESEMT